MGIRQRDAKRRLFWLTRASMPQQSTELTMEPEYRTGDNKERKTEEIQQSEEWYYMI